MEEELSRYPNGLRDVNSMQTQGQKNSIAAQHVVLEVRDKRDVYTCVRSYTIRKSGYRDIRVHAWQRFSLLSRLVDCSPVRGISV